MSDFGLSNYYFESTDPNIVVGTPGYMAPELFIKGRKRTSKQDVWSFGVICLEMITGGLPWKKDLN